MVTIDNSRGFLGEDVEGFSVYGGQRRGGG